MSNFDIVSNARKTKKKKALIVAVAVLAVLIAITAPALIYLTNLLNSVDRDTQPDYVTQSPDDPLAGLNTVPAGETIPNDELESNDASGPELSDEELDINSQELEENVGSQQIVSDKNVTNILLIGRDTASEQNYSRSDAMIIVSVNKSSKSVKLASIQRDIYANIPGRGNDKLNHSHAYGGAKLTIKTIESNFHIKIDKYISVNFTSFKKIIDRLGGVNIDLSQKEIDHMKSKFAVSSMDFSSGAGSYKLNGDAALAYSRIRYIDTDAKRTNRQRNILNEIFRKMGDMSVPQLLSLAEEILPLVSTNMSNNDFVSLGANLVSFKSSNTGRLDELTIPLSTASKGGMVKGRWYYILDWQPNISALQKFLYE